MKKCPICEAGPFKTLGQHFRWSHEISYRDYLLQNPPPCEACGGPITPPENSRVHAEYLLERRFCSKRCEGKGKRGDAHPMWRGGKGVSTQGYRVIRVNGKPKLEHRHVMEQVLGRPLKRSEIVHHRDGDKLNNDPSNLELVDRASHIVMHRPHEEHTPESRRRTIETRRDRHGY